MYKSYACVLTFLVSAGAWCLHGQTAGGAVDLSSSVLQANAALPRHNPPGERLVDLLSRAQVIATAQSLTSDGIDQIIFDDIGDASGINPTSITALYKKRACSADVIVTGHPTKWQYHLSASGTAIYGDYDFAIDSVLKDDPAKPHIKGLEIVVTRPGGTMTLGTGTIRNVTFKMESFPQLQPDHSYLIFLQYIQASGAFEAIDAFATFARSGPTWFMARKAFSGLTLPLFSQGIFEPAIQQWLASCRN